MFEGCRPMGRLFYLLLMVAMMAGQAGAQSPPTTTISDTVYRADGNPAGGVLLIFWPAFTTAGGQTVAAGTASATLGSGGALTVGLVSNTGATPTGTLYTVVYQLDDGTSKTEYWAVPTSSPATIAQVRTPLGVTGSVAQAASEKCEHGGGEQGKRFGGGPPGGKRDGDWSEAVQRCAERACAGAVDRGAMERFRVGPGEQPEPGGTVRVGNFYVAAIVAGADSFPEAI